MLDGLEQRVKHEGYFLFILSPSRCRSHLVFPPLLVKVIIYFLTSHGEPIRARYCPHSWIARIFLHAQPDYAPLLIGFLLSLALR